MRTRFAPLLALALTSCVPTQFEDLRDQASTIAIVPPNDYGPRGFGRVVIGYAGTLHGDFASRVAISGGDSSPFEVAPMLTSDALGLDSRILSGCDSDAPCMMGAGISLAGLPRWGDREMCVAVAAPDSGEVKIRCEDDPSRLDIAMGPGAQRFGATAVGLPEHALARALFGAPSAHSGSGAVYRLPDRAPPVEIDLTEGAGAGTQLGAALAAGVLDESTLVIAAAAPVGVTKRVIIATSTIASDGSVTTHARDCLDETAEGWGQALAVGDLNGDSLPEVIIGSGPAMGRIDVVRVYDGASMPAEGTCDGSWASAIELACPSQEGIDCSSGDFGAAVAVGDVDADGIGDLVVGAPGANVNGLIDSGALFVFRGAASLADLDATVVALAPSSPKAGGRLGAAVATVPGAESDGIRRAEPIAGAPGMERAYIFLCTGLDGDSVTTVGDRCQP